MFDWTRASDPAVFLISAYKSITLFLPPKIMRRSEIILVLAALQLLCTALPIQSVQAGDEQIPCFPRVFQTDLVAMSSKCDMWGLGTLMRDADNSLQRLDIANNEFNMSVIYRFDQEMLYVVHTDEENACEKYSLKGMSMPPPCLENDSKKARTILFGVDTKADVWDSTLKFETGQTFAVKVAFDQKPLGGNKDEFSKLWRAAKEGEEDRDRAPISLAIHNKYTGVFFYQFNTFKKMDKIDREMFEPPTSCKGESLSGHASEFLSSGSVPATLALLPPRLQNALGLF